MSRVFRRPMFRKGGGVNMNGIMSGIEDRQNFSTGTNEMGNLPSYEENIPTVEELTTRNLETLQKAGGERTGFDPLTTFLLQYGPAAASQTGSGGTLGNLVAAAKDPVATLIKNQADEDKYQRELRTQAAGAAIKKVDDITSAAAERKFKTNLFNQETNRLLNLQENDFSQEVKILGLKQDFEGDIFEKERALKLNLQKIDNAFKSDMLTQEQKNKLEILQKEYESALGLLEAEMAGTTGIDKRIEEGAQKLVDDEVVGTYAEAENQLTWQYKTSGDLMKKGYNVSDELLTEQIVLDPKNFTKKARKLSKKPGNEGRIFYFPKGDQYFVLEGETFKPFDLPGSESKKKTNENSEDKGSNVTEEVDGITNYEYGTGDKRDQATAIRQTKAKLEGPAFKGDKSNRMTLDQKRNAAEELKRYEQDFDRYVNPLKLKDGGPTMSAYERYLSEYRNQ